MSYKSDDEALADYESSMGRDLGSLYYRLWKECAWLHARWAEYVQVFGSKEEYFTTMNSVAPRFFRSVQDAFLETVLLHICRLTDNREVSGKKTLSLEALISFAHLMPNAGLASLVKQAKDASKFARDWRNQWIAHKSFASEAVPFASRADVEKALEAIVAVLSAVEASFSDIELSFDLDSIIGLEGVHVVRSLALIERLRTERMARIKSGSATADDLDWEKWR